MNSLELYDIYDFWYEPPWFIIYFYWVMFLFLLLILVFLGYYGYRKRLYRKKSCWQIALGKLDLLHAQALKDRTLFYFTLTDILKEYIVERYALDVWSKTDLEMVEYLTNHGVPPEIEEDLKKIFSGTTMAKFAHQKMDDYTIQQNLLMSVRLIKNSIPKGHSPS